MKICFRCKIEKDDSQFNKKRNGLSSYCKVCNALNLKEHYNKNKSYYLDKNQNSRKQIKIALYEWLSTKSCKDCGISDVRVLEFDHVKGQKVMDIGKMLNSMPSVHTLITEISKCEIVCANCHRIRTLTRAGDLKSMYLPT